MIGRAFKAYTDYLSKLYNPPLDPDGSDSFHLKEYDIPHTPMYVNLFVDLKSLEIDFMTVELLTLKGFLVRTF